MTNDNWHTLRVPPEAYDAAKEQKEEHGRTWGQQIVRDSDNDTTTDTIDVDELEDRIVSRLARETEADGSQDADELAREVSRQLDYAALSSQIADEVVGRM